MMVRRFGVGERVVVWGETIGSMLAYGAARRTCSQRESVR